MKTSDFDYPLPPESIAQTPIEPRDHSRLMVLHRAQQSIEHSRFYELPEFLRPGDLLVFNDSRVLPARLFGQTESGAKVEVLLLRRAGEGVWETVTKPSKRTHQGARLVFSSPPDGLTAEVLSERPDGTRVIKFSSEDLFEKLGHAPLPPYIKAPLADPERYQTVYARVKGSAAAPTAGLHFTPDLLQTIQEKGVQFAFVTLHIGLDTFRPVRVEDPTHHHIHTEYGVVSPETAQAVNQAKQEGRRVIAVGTTSVRLLEAAASDVLHPLSSPVSLFILPGYRFRVVDAIITNFHLPRSTLLMLVSAFSGREFILRAYNEAREQGYRFYSFGDAMLIF